MLLPFRVRCLLFCGLLMAQATTNSFADLTITDFRREGVSAIKTSRRAERALLSRPRSIQTQPRVRLSRGTRDFLEAIERQRPFAVKAVGNVRSYAATLSLDQATTLKGFTYEQNLLRRWNSQRGPNRYELAGVNHEFADLWEVDRATGDVRRSLQVYSGGNPRAALDKLLISDADADKLVIPRDCFEKIDDVLNSVSNKSKGILSALRSGQLDEKAGLRQVRRQLQKIGIQFDQETMTASFRGQSLGRIDAPSFREQFTRKLVRDQLSSPVIYDGQLKSQVEMSGRFDRLRQWAGNGRQANKIVMAAYSQRRLEYLRSGKTESVAARKATRWIEQTLSNDSIESLIQTERRASLLGVSQEELVATRASFQGDPIQHKVQLESRARQRWRATEFKAQGIVLGMTAVGAGADFAFGDRDFSDWLKGRGPEWAARATTASGAVAVASFLERRLLQSAGANAGRSVVQSAGRRLVIGGTAGAIFITGEALIAVAFRGASLAEVSDMAMESALVMTISSGAVLGADYLLAAAGAGSWAGPVGTAVAVGTTLLYEGAKYAYRHSYELEGDRMVFSARCDVARQKVDRWCEESCARARAIR